LNNPVFLGSASDGYLQYAISHGRRGTIMLAFTGNLSDEEIDDLVALIRSWSP
ncbi:MAG: cytochrome c, partial [bacterium]|nr:cytochrome c [bacterium]